MEALLTTLRSEIEGNLREVVGAPPVLHELSEATTSKLVVTNMKRAKIAAREKQLTRDLHKYVQKASDDVVAQWRQQHTRGSMVMEVQRALKTLQDRDTLTPDAAPTSILRILRTAVSDGALKAKARAVANELERERTAALIDAWKDVLHLPIASMAKLRRGKPHFLEPRNQARPNAALGVPGFKIS